MITRRGHLKVARTATGVLAGEVATAAVPSNGRQTILLDGPRDSSNREYGSMKFRLAAKTAGSSHRHATLPKQCGGANATNELSNRASSTSPKEAGAPAGIPRSGLTIRPKIISSVHRILGHAPVNVARGQI